MNNPIITYFPQTQEPECSVFPVKFIHCPGCMAAIHATCGNNITFMELWVISKIQAVGVSESICSYTTYKSVLFWENIQHTRCIPWKLSLLYRTRFHCENSRLSRIVRTDEWKWLSGPCQGMAGYSVRRVEGTRSDGKWVESGHHIQWGHHTQWAVLDKSVINSGWRYYENWAPVHCTVLST